MKAQRKISFTIELKTGETVTYMANNEAHMILMVAALKKHHKEVRVIKDSIEVSRVLVIETNGRTTIVAKAG
jgi:hypothetical protein